MIRKFGITLVAFVLILSTNAQQKQPLPPGFPDRSSSLDVLPGFKSPPKGYGEVSFYWWIGDTLTHERILSQMDQLKDKGITGLQINYCHTDKGGATYGLTYPSQPALFSDKWWELFQWFLKEAKKRDMSVSLSDYTLGAAGQGWFVDEMLKENPGLHGTKLEAKQFEIKGEQEFKSTLPENIINASAYRITQGRQQDSSPIDLLPLIKNSELIWNVPSGDWKIIAVYKTTVQTSFDPMNPLSGKKVVEKFYQRFEDHCPGEAGKGLNFFFSDELQFGIRGFLWNDQFAAEFKKRKGYELMPELPALFADLGPRSYKIRLDYNDVMVSLSEDGFFKPVYNWHNDRGMLFGCDHGGRGRDVTEFGDYFRTQRWMSGPGCDQPGLGKDIVKNKVASSIAHLYERPRTWLEGFYGSGWGTSSEEVADATFANFAMGQNLLSLHGLYYSTHGSWWEWAAPDNHWRQPYWDNMGSFLNCTERLSYILSQGHHRCDVAMVYPVAPMEANLKGKESVETSFSIARDLYPNGIDFDFMDFESLNRCKIQDKELNVSGEKYKVLVLPALSAVRFSTMAKALEFYKAGGIVLAVGALPQASDRTGGNDPNLQTMLREMFGTTAFEPHDTTKVYLQRSLNGGYGIFLHNPQAVKEQISKLLQPDFKILAGSNNSSIMHRKLGNRDLYFVYGVPKGTECFFRATGKVELWNPWNGTTSVLKVTSSSSDGTKLKLPLEKNEPQLIVFSPGKAVVESVSQADTKFDTISLDNNWEFELKPTLDNKYGDYRLPAFDGKIGVEVWKMKFSEESFPGTDWTKSDFDDSSWSEASVSFGPQFWKLGPFPETADREEIDSKLASLNQINPKEPVEIGSVKYFWKPYEFSWRWGLKGDAGHQGYHGLKGNVNSELISLGKLDNSRKHMPTYPLKQEEGGDGYYLWTTVSAPNQGVAKIMKSGMQPEKSFVNGQKIETGALEVPLKTGSNPLLLKYKGTGRGYFLFQMGDSANGLRQTFPLSTSWYQQSFILPFNCNLKSSVNFGCYRLIAPPGARTMTIQSYSRPEVWLAGAAVSVEASLVADRFADKKVPVWKVQFLGAELNSTIVALRIKQIPGFFGGAAIPEPILFDCGKGMIKLGDLAENESLKTYSGGMWYRKTITMKAQQLNSKQIILNLGRVVSSAEVLVNGKSVGAKVSSPWTFDLTGKLVAGENRLEILIFNTLGNHYLTTPSQYIGRINSGLIGPVSIEIR